MKELKKLIKEEFKNNKNLYDDKEEPLIGLHNGELYFFDGNLNPTNKINFHNPIVSGSWIICSNCEKIL